MNFAQIAHRACLLCGYRITCNNHISRKNKHQRAQIRKWQKQQQKKKAINHCWVLFLSIFWWFDVIHLNWQRYKQKFRKFKFQFHIKASIIQSILLWANIGSNAEWAQITEANYSYFKKKMGSQRKSLMKR